MLKIRNLIFVLGLSPLIFAVWQLPSQAGPPLGKDNGNNNNTGSTITRFSVPTGGGGTTGGGTTGGGTIPPVTTVGGQTITLTIVIGVSPSINTGASTTGGLSASSTAIPVSTATVASNASSATVTNSPAGNSVVLSVSPPVQAAVNQLAAAIIQTLSTTGGGTTGGTTGGGTTGGGTTGGGTTGGGTTGGGSAANVASLLTGGAGSQAALSGSFTAAGISPQLVTALLTSLTGLFGSTRGSLLNLPVAATPGQLVASTKALKPILVIAQSGAAINVDINKLNDAIVAYNGIILTSEAENLRKLYKDTDFVGIGKVLKELRKSVQ
jgi:hypothetical protein